jgi:hypothetical protein
VLPICVDPLIARDTRTKISDIRGGNLTVYFRRTNLEENNVTVGTKLDTGQDQIRPFFSSQAICGGDKKNNMTGQKVLKCRPAGLISWG